MRPTLRVSISTESTSAEARCCAYGGRSTKRSAYSSNRLPQWQHAFPEFRRPSAAIHAHAPFCESSQESSLDAYAAEPRAMQYHDIRLRERKIRLTVLSQVDSLWFGESFR